MTTFANKSFVTNVLWQFVIFSFFTPNPELIRFYGKLSYVLLYYVQTLCRTFLYYLSESVKIHCNLQSGYNTVPLRPINLFALEQLVKKKLFSAM